MSVLSLLSGVKLTRRIYESTSTTLAESFEVRHGYVFDSVDIVEATAEG
jgi:hypothetical protein